MTSPSEERSDLEAAGRDAKVVVAMSGGVDSSVSAWLLKRRGYAVEGLFMKNWEEDDAGGRCSSEDDLNDARSACRSLDIRLHTANFSAEYWEQVFEPFLDGHRRGYTPNPDVLCNEKIKFGLFLDFAVRELGARYVATGHYVRHRRDAAGNSCLMRGLDQEKDQSYFLHALSQRQLDRCLFPLGDLLKVEVRALARKLHLPNADKRSSAGICFVGRRDMRSFLRSYLPEDPGLIVSADGRRLGSHRGLMYFTIGQRRGTGVGGRRGESGAPWYVVEKDLHSNSLILSQSRIDPRFMTAELDVDQPSWINPDEMELPLRCAVKIRYRQPDLSGIILPRAGGGIRLRFEEPVAVVAPGQSAVFYQADRCLGGGVIARRHLSSGTPISPDRSEEQHLPDLRRAHSADRSPPRTAD